ncbi:MAG: peptide ABC transporter substrate-binding protein [Verrucomicrobia bacterium]|nr:peptide ABC transporter substrate-binding protein [Verrucomicrobiota bacterium]
MRISFYMDPLTVDPRKNGDLYSSAFLYMLYDGLTRLLANGAVELSLAESVQVSPDGKTYQFQLRDANWSDGHPITAYDFEYSWKKTLDPQFHSTCPQLFFPIKNAEAALKGAVPLNEVGIYAIDARTLKIELEHPTPYFLSLLSCSNFFPVPKHIAETRPDWDSIPLNKLVSSGPFVLARWERQYEITLIKNPLFWDADHTNLTHLTIRIVKNEFSTLEMFENDELDWVCSLTSSVPQEALFAYQESGRLTVAPLGATTFCTYNMQQFPFTNVNIRKAFSYAIDRQKLLEQAKTLNGAPAIRWIPPVLDNNQNIQLIPPFQEKLAKSYLQKGMAELDIRLDTNDIRFRLFLDNLTLSYDESPYSNRAIAKALQEQWRKVLGFNIKLIFQDYKTQMENIMKKNYCLSLQSSVAQYNDSMNILERYKYRELKKNFPGYEDQSYIDLLNRSLMETGDKRRNTLIDLEKQFLDQMPVAPLLHYHCSILSKKSVSGVTINPIGTIRFHRAKCEQTKVKTNKIAVC